MFGTAFRKFAFDLGGVHLVHAFFLVLCFPLFLIGDEPSSGSSAPLPSETFVAGCDLILFGSELPKVVREGRSGYLVSRNDGAVMINDIVFFSTATPSPKPLFDPQIKKRMDVIEAASKLVRENQNKKSGVVAIGSETHQVGDAFSLAVPQHDAVVTVLLTGVQAMLITYDDQKMYFIEAPEMEPADPVAVAYASVIELLRPGRLVIKGRGYAFSFPLSEADDVRKSLSKIPGLAKVNATDPLGVVYYEPLTIDGYLWSNGVIRDFVGSE